uniref:protein dead ringer homolog isoform X1 n=1 Tax=Styela clava TaxID=7725 RepID=UPI001939980E|nr:protein dead ringer homolog isoform X1 [Styela clava]
MMLGNLAQAQQELITGLGAGLGRTGASTMKLEAVMENLQRQHEQRMRDQQHLKSPGSDDVTKVDDVNHDDNGNEDSEDRNGVSNLGIFATQRPALSSPCSGSPKAGSLVGSHRGENSENGDMTPDRHHHDHRHDDDDDSEINYVMNSPRENREIDSFSRRRSESNSPRSDKSLGMKGPGNAAAVAVAQQAALAAAFAASANSRDGSPTSSAGVSMAQFFPGAMAAAAGHSSLANMQSAAVANTLAQQFGQFPPGMGFDPAQLAQLPQGVREFAILQQQQMAAQQMAEAHKRIQEQHAMSVQHHNSLSMPLIGSNGPGHTSSASSTTSSPTNTQQHGDRRGSQQEWTFEEQFKQLYEIDDDPVRKQFLDELFTFMQKRGTPVNRIPIMAKQVLDLYQLYRLVVEKGGLVEVINKKIWREITKGLNLPSSITSAAFTLRTQYMKYLYPFECEKEKLSQPSELQAAIEGNRREGRRPSYSSHMFSYSPSAATGLTPPKLPYHSHNGLSQFPKYGVVPGQCDLPTSPTQQLVAQQQQLIQAANAQHVAAMAALEAIQHQAKARAAHAAQQAAHHAAQQAAQHHLAVKHERNLDTDDSDMEPPQKRKASSDDMARRHQITEQDREDSHHHQPHAESSQSRDHNSESVSNMKILMSHKGSTQSDASMTVETLADSNCINMSIDVNGVKYQGVLFARGSASSPPPVNHIATSEARQNHSPHSL